MTTIPGSVSDALQTGLREASREDRERILAAPTLEEALCDLIMMVHGRQAYVTTRTPYSKTRVVAYSITGLAESLDPYAPREPGHTVVAAIDLGHPDYTEWIDCTPITRPNWAREREELLIGTLIPMQVVPNVMEEMLTGVPGRTVSSHFSQIAVMTWWEARMAEGYTPDVARTLLALRATPEVLGYVEWLPDGTPRPRVRPQEETSDSSSD